jgi:hypothetical protein
MPFRRRFGNPYAVVHLGDVLTGCRDHALIELRTSADVAGSDRAAQARLISRAWASIE